MGFLINLKKLGVNTTVLATSISLVACGGGGSDGYYNNGSSSGNTEGGNTNDNNQSETDTSNVATHLTRALQNASGQEIQLAPDDSKVYLAVKALNADNGGIANKNIRLTIATNKFGVTSTNSLVATGTNGVAIFEINVPELAEAEGSVQVTATVDGTSVSIPYTLNIKKSSTIVSDYNISVTQGAVIDIPDGSVDVIATVTDAKGGIKANQSVTLNMPEAMRGKFIISNGAATQVTNAEGQVKYTLKVSSDFRSDDVDAFVGKSETLTFVLVDEHKAERLDTADLTFKVTSQLLYSTLSVIKPDLAVAAKSTTPVIIKVLAKNIQGEPLKDQDVRLNFEKDELAYGVKLNNVTAKTNAQGVAEFSISTADVTHPIALSETGISLKATYVDNSVKVSASTIVGVVTENVNASDPEAIQRLEIASSYKVNAKNDSVAVTVKAINNKGLAATKGKVKLDLNAEATSNGVTLDGAAEKDLVNGFATFNIKTNAQTPAAVEALVKAGIKANFTTDNGVSNAIAITVANEEVSEEATRYLAIDPITSSTDPKLAVFDYTKTQTFTVKVKAVGVNGSALIGETVSLNIAGSLSDEQLQDLGLSHTGQSSKQTGTDGYATFTIDYKANSSPEQAALAIQGVPLVATSANGKTQTLRLNFKAPTEQGVIDLDHFTVDMLGDLTLTVGQEQTLTVNVTAKGTDGELLKNQLISIGLNDAALNNGVSYVSTQAIRTDENGHAKFTIKVKAGNVTELTNLIANGLTVVVKSTRTDGSAFTVIKKVDVAQPPVVLPDLANFLFTTIEDKPLDPISVLGGETRVKITAVDEKGNPIPNTPIAIALSSLTSSRVSLSNIPTQTNSDGEAEFTVTVAEGEYDPSLIKNGIIFAVVGTNLNNGDRLQQTGAINITAPANALNPRLTSDEKTVTAGQTIKVYAAVKDEMGVNTVTGTPMRLSLNKEAIDAGVKLKANGVDIEGVLIPADSSIEFSLEVPKGITTDILQSIRVTGVIRDPKGNEIPAILTFTVEDVENPNHLEINSFKNTLNPGDDRTVVVVRLLDASNNPVRNEEVTLAVRKTNTTTGKNVGFITEENTSDENNHPLPENIAEKWTVKTDEDGRGFFTLYIPKEGFDKDALIASGITLDATNTTNGIDVKQVLHLNVTDPTSTTPRHNIFIKPDQSTINVVDGTATVSVSLRDQFGGAVSNEYITLNLKNSNFNGAYIQGASGIVTNNNGEAKFIIKIDESLRRNYTETAFINEDLELSASFSGATQTHILDVVRKSVNNLVINITDNHLEPVANGNAYEQTLKATVKDELGNLVKEQNVSFEIKPQSYIRGQNLWALAPTNSITPPTSEMKWVFAGQRYYQGDNAANPELVNQSLHCNFAVDVTQVTNANVALDVVKFKASNDATWTGVTNNSGEINFVITYPKTYAQWLNVRIDATAESNSYRMSNSYPHLLRNQQGNDKDFNGIYSINAISPFGTNTSECTP